MFMSRYTVLCGNSESREQQLISYSPTCAGDNHATVSQTESQIQTGYTVLCGKPGSRERHPVVFDTWQPSQYWTFKCRIPLVRILVGDSRIARESKIIPTRDSKCPHVATAPVCDAEFDSCPCLLFHIGERPCHESEYTLICSTVWATAGSSAYVLWRLRAVGDTSKGECGVTHVGHTSAYPQATATHEENKKPDGTDTGRETAAVTARDTTCCATGHVGIPQVGLSLLSLSLSLTHSSHPVSVLPHLPSRNHTPTFMSAKEQIPTQKKSPLQRLDGQLCTVNYSPMKDINMSVHACTCKSDKVASVCTISAHAETSHTYQNM
ncbi:hypothetical protein J6590_015146 [Homalodisca vitripennis]|nr:hypothetical protein J6590_015146 [Homalodisca vitripennis]